MLVEDASDGSTVQLCSYAPKNHVFFNPGIGPPIDPPASVTLK